MISIRTPIKHDIHKLKYRQQSTVLLHPQPKPKPTTPNLLLSLHSSSMDAFTAVITYFYSEEPTVIVSEDTPVGGTGGGGGCTIA
jgi:hypothetical protein